jgi:hypothetical protein
MAPQHCRSLIEICDTAKGVGHIDRCRQFVDNPAEMVVTRIHSGRLGKENLGACLGYSVAENISHGRTPQIGQPPQSSSRLD